MKKLLLLLLILISLSVFAQYPKWINYTYGGNTNTIAVEGNFLWIGTEGGLVKINKITNENVYYNHANSGLPSNVITTIAIDKNKIKWIGTSFGMVRFDEKTWQLFDTLNSDLPDNSIRIIKTDNYNNKWIGTPNGLAVYNDTSFTIYDTVNSGIVGNNIGALEIDKNNIKWIASYPLNNNYINLPGGIAKYDDIKWTKYISNIDSVPQLFWIHYLKNDGKNIWVGTSNGLYKFDGSSWINYNQNNTSTYLASVKCIEVDQSGNLWTGTIWGGLVKFDGTDWFSYLPSNSGINSEHVYSLAIDSSGFIYAGTAKGTVDTYDGNEWKAYATHSWHLLSNNITAIAVDSNDSKWISTLGGGLSMINGNAHTIYYTSNSKLIENTLNSVAVNKNNNIWLGTYSRGAIEFDGINWNEYNPSNSIIPSYKINTIFVDDTNNIWIGCAGIQPSIKGGLAKINDKKSDVFFPSKMFSSSISDEVLAINIDNYNKIWLGLGSWNGGLVGFDSSGWNSYQAYNSGIPENYVQAIEVDNNNNKWIGTRIGLGLFDNFVWDYFFPGKGVRAVKKDNLGNIWVGFGDKYLTDSDTLNGLAKFDGKNWTIYNRSNSGLPENNVSCLAVDKFNNVWIGTEHSGIVVFNENGIFTNVVENKILNKVNSYLLSQNYPNPFNPTTTIRYQIPKAGFVSLNVYDILGKEVATLVNEEKPTGSYEVEFPRRGEVTSPLQSGVYFYRLQLGDFMETKKFILMK